MTDDPPTLTSLLLTQVGLWRTRAEELDAQIRALTSERDGFVQKISAAEIIIGVPLKPEAPPEEEEEERLTLSKAVMAVMADGTAREPNQIRAELPRVGFDAAKVSSRSGFFYTKLTQLVERGQLTRSGGRYYLPGNEPAAEKQQEEVAPSASN